MKAKSKGSRELLKSGEHRMSMRLRRGATKMWQENREGVSLKERVNEKTRESQPKTPDKEMGIDDPDLQKVSWLISRVATPRSGQHFPTEWHHRLP